MHAAIHQQQAYRKKPVYIIGAGGIVNAAHLPAYSIAGFNVQGIFDINYHKAKETAEKFAVPAVYASWQALLDALPADAVLDIAVPGKAIIQVLEQLPGGMPLLLQKPMGETLGEAKKILSITRQKKMLAAVNFQLRYAPFVLQAEQMIQSGTIGEVNDIEINVNVFTPWQLWDFLYASPRVEILYHSINYIDLVRHLWGNPQAVYAKTTQHPSMKDLAPVKSNIIMDYGNWKRANILTNHCHIYGEDMQQSYIKLEGSKGAIKIDFGALKNYPAGAPDNFSYVLMEGERPRQWQRLPIAGTWFPHAFIGSMEQVLMAAAGLIDRPDNSVEDCIHTMACMEAAYLSSEQGGVRPDYFSFNEQDGG